MKMKSLAAFGMAGLLAASIVYVAPAMADDAADAAGLQNLAAMDQNSMQNDDTATNATNNDTTTNSTDNNAAPGDQGSPDTATGDDDY